MLNPINLLFPRQDKTIASLVQFLLQERKKNFYTPRVYTATERKKNFFPIVKIVHVMLWSYLVEGIKDLWG